MLEFDDVQRRLHLGTYEELWDVSVAQRPELDDTERRVRIDELLDPLLDPNVPDGDRAWLVIDVFRAMLAVRLAPVLAPSAARTDPRR